MDSEHESEDEFATNNDDTRTEDGSDRGEPEDGVKTHQTMLAWKQQNQV